MLSPSTAPRWKIAIMIFLRACVACAARAMNAGVKPRLTSAAEPFRRKTLRVIMFRLLSLLEFRRAERQRDELLRGFRAADRLARRVTHLARQQRRDRVIDRRRGGVRREAPHVHLNRRARELVGPPLQHAKLALASGAALPVGTLWWRHHLIAAAAAA